MRRTSVRAMWNDTIPPRPDLADEDLDRTWTVHPPDEPGVTKRAFEIWRRTWPEAAGLTIFLAGIPNLVGRLLMRPSESTTDLSVWLHTGHFPRYFATGPRPAPNPLSFPLSLLSVVLIPLLYVTLLRLMMGSSVGEEPLGLRRALSRGWKRLAHAIVIGLCISLI